MQILSLYGRTKAENSQDIVKDFKMKYFALLDINDYYETILIKVV
jgi:hypothetical protein